MEHKIEITDNMTVGELYKEMVKTVDAFGTEATFSLQVDKYCVTLIPRSKNERV